MILDSEIWKKEIENQITSINSILNIQTNKVEDDEDNFQPIIFIELQKFTIYTSILIRKLIEANKISEELLSKNYPIITYRKNEKIMTILDSYEIEKLYKLNEPKKSLISIEKLANFLIHSYHFIPYYSAENLELASEGEELIKPSGFYFTSDKIKKREICLINMSQYTDILNEIISDFIYFGQIENGEITKVSSRKTPNNKNK